MNQANVAPKDIIDRDLGAALVCVGGAIVAFVGLIVGRVEPAAGRADMWEWGWPLLAALVGSGAVWTYWHRFRILGFIPLASTVLLLGTIAVLLIGTTPAWLVALISAAAGVIPGALLRYDLPVRRWERRNPETVRFIPRLPPTDFVIFLLLLTGPVIGICILFLVAPVAEAQRWGERFGTYQAVSIGFALCCFAWWRFFRPFFELCIEPILWKGYRVRAVGPGMAAVPYHGPLLVVANHACWWDPLFIAKVLPRPVTPMMTSRFYDRWFLRPIMAYTFRVIRVPEAKIRREAPELRDAIAALDAGQCVIIFPEGFLRRKEEQPIKRFGRGVWQILKARPETPVLACWIEGNWGSWTSYFNGPPTRNKKPEFRRPIGVGVSTPVLIPADVLEQHLPTRLALMNLVLAARAHLGLPPVPPVVFPSKGDEEQAGESA